MSKLVPATLIQIEATLSIIQFISSITTPSAGVTMHAVS